VTGPLDPAALVRDFTDNYVNFYRLWRGGATAPPGVEIRTPAERPIEASALPEGLRTILADYRRSYPDETVEFVKYMRLEDGQLVELVEDDRGLPGEEALVSLSRTLTLITRGTARVVTEIFVGSRRLSERSKSP
jgi:hypothetical protein